MKPSIMICIISCAVLSVIWPAFGQLGRNIGNVASAKASTVNFDYGSEVQKIAEKPLPSTPKLTTPLQTKLPQLPPLKNGSNVSVPGKFDYNVDTPKIATTTKPQRNSGSAATTKQPVTEDNDDYDLYDLSTSYATKKTPPPTTAKMLVTPQKDNLCDFEPSIANGYVTLSTGTVTVFCNSGFYIQDPPSEVTCDRDKEQWIGLPSCIRATCGAPQVRNNLMIEGSSFDGSNSVPGSSFRYKCANGYWMFPATSEVVCGKTGRWSMRAPTCLKLGDATTWSSQTTPATTAQPQKKTKNCGAEPTIENGAVFTRTYSKVDSARAGDFFYYVCAKDFSVEGQGGSMGRIQCDGTVWSSSANCLPNAKTTPNFEYPDDANSGPPSSKANQSTPPRAFDNLGPRQERGKASAKPSTARPKDNKDEADIYEEYYYFEEGGKTSERSR